MSVHVCSSMCPLSMQLLAAPLNECVVLLGFLLEVLFVLPTNSATGCCVFCCREAFGQNTEGCRTVPANRRRSAPEADWRVPRRPVRAFALTFPRCSVSPKHAHTRARLSLWRVSCSCQWYVWRAARSLTRHSHAFNKSVLYAYVDLFNFAGQEIDQALRCGELRSLRVVSCASDYWAC